MAEVIIIPNDKLVPQPERTKLKDLGTQKVQPIRASAMYGTSDKGPYSFFSVTYTKLSKQVPVSPEQAIASGHARKTAKGVEWLTTQMGQQVSPEGKVTLTGGAKAK